MNGLYLMASSRRHIIGFDRGCNGSDCRKMRTDVYADGHRKDENSKVWWAYVEGYKGIHIFSFDRVRTFNLFRDYPYKLTEEEKRIFDECEPFWARFFKNRTKG